MSNLATFLVKCVDRGCRNKLHGLVCYLKNCFEKGKIKWHFGKHSGMRCNLFDVQIVVIGVTLLTGVRLHCVISCDSWAVFVE